MEPFPLNNYEFLTGHGYIDTVHLGHPNAIRDSSWFYKIYFFKLEKWNKRTLHTTCCDGDILIFTENEVAARMILLSK